MKNYIKILFLLFATAFFASCDNNDEVANILETENYVYFSRTNSGTINEAKTSTTSADGSAVTVNNRGSFLIERTGASTENAIDVTVAVSSQYTSTTDFQDEGDDASDAFITSFDQIVTIPAGRSFGTFSISIVDDLLSSGNKEVTFTITDVSDNSYTIGFPGDVAPTDEDLPPSISQTVLIQDDDCPIDLTLFEGLYEVTDIAPSGSFNDGTSIKTDVSPYRGPVLFTIDPNDPTNTTGLLTNGTAADGTVGNFVATEPYSIKFNTCAGQIEFASLRFGPANFAIFPSADNLTSYKEDGSSFSVNGVLRRPTGASNFGLWDVTFTKVQ